MIISHLFHYLPFILLLGSSKLARTRMALAAKLYWVKLTELVTQACRKNKTPTLNFSVIALLLNWHLLSLSVTLSEWWTEKCYFSQCDSQWKNGFSLGDVGIFFFFFLGLEMSLKQTNKCTIQLVPLNKYSTQWWTEKKHTALVLA